MSKKKYSFSLWFDGGEKIELVVKSWSISDGFLFLDLLSGEYRSMNVDRVREFVIKENKSEG